MSPFSSEEYARRVVRVVQIIVAALAMGLIVFAGIAMSLRMNQQQQQPQQPDDILAYLAVGFAVVTLAEGSSDPALWPAIVRTSPRGPASYRGLAECR